MTKNIAPRLLRIANSLRRLEAGKEEEDSKGSGKKPGAKFLEFLEEFGSKKLKNPDTGNTVMLKSLNGPKGKKLVQKEFQKWLDKNEGKADKGKADKGKADKGKADKGKKEAPKGPKSGIEKMQKEAPKQLANLDLLEEEANIEFTMDVREALEAYSKGTGVNNPEKTLRYFNKDIAERVEVLKDQGREDTIEDFASEIGEIKAFLKAVMDR